MRDIYTCEFCGVPYRVMWRLMDHRWKHHGDEIHQRQQEREPDPFARFERGRAS